MYVEVVIEGLCVCVGLPRAVLGLEVYARNGRAGLENVWCV